MLQFEMLDFELLNVMAGGERNVTADCLLILLIYYNIMTDGCQFGINLVRCCSNV